MNGPVPTVSVVVPAYNQASLLIRLLESLDRQTVAPEMEVIVVDDCSTDDTPAQMQAWLTRPHPSPYRYIRLEKNSGPGHARNVGAAAAVAPLVAFTDTDCVATTEWLAKLRGGMRAGEKIAGTGGGVRALHLNSPFARYNELNSTLQPPQDTTTYLVTCNCCYLREPLLAVGGFDETIPVPGGEDVAASIRLYKQGWRFAFAPDALIYHDYRETRERFERTWRNYGFGCALTVHRLLSPQELHAKRPHDHIPNFWAIRSVAPTVTGIPSLLVDLVWFGNRVRKKKVGLRASLEAERMRIVERRAYYEGWREGVRAYLAENPEAAPHVRWR